MTGCHRWSGANVWVARRCRRCYDFPAHLAQQSREVLQTAHRRKGSFKATYLDFEDCRNRAALESAEPEQRIRGLVRKEEDRSAPSIGATGKLSVDGKVFEVAPDAGQESHPWNWEWLQEKLGQYR